MSMQYREILKQLRDLSNPDAVAGMARFGINPHNTYGVSLPNLRRMAKHIGENHNLALRLWASGIHEGRILACLVDSPAAVGEEQMESWVKDFDSWDVCDQCCSNLFDKTRFAYRKATQWSRRKEEFVKRAGFVLMATLAVHDREAKDEAFDKFLPIIKRESTDERNFVKKAVNWALRQIGKRNLYLNRRAMETARDIQAIDSRAARWIGADALRELSGAAVQKKLRK
jgi:3-methyladenine DNA glycosylase AlkD